MDSAEATTTDYGLPPWPAKRLFGGIAVAIVGADGCGKSTISGMLVEDAPEIVKYLYMGASIEASSVSLPTSRMLVRLKRKRLRMHDDATRLPPADVMSAQMKSQLPRGRIVKALGVINRIAEEWYRQCFVWIYKARGHLVVCDRHFLYEYFPNAVSRRTESRPLSVRLHDTILGRFFPRPDLTFFLDAPADVLYARKPEWTTAHIEQQREGILEQGRVDRNFIRIDATQPVDKVYSDVARAIGLHWVVA